MVSNVAALWFLLVLFAVYTTGWLIVPGVRQRARDGARLRRAVTLRRQRLSTLAAESTRYASEVTVAADRASAREARLREAWRATQGDLEAAERVFDAADERWRRLTQAAAFRGPRAGDGSRAEDEPGAQVRYLRRVLTEACLRGELSPLVLGDAMAGRDGWDLRRPVAEQERQLSKVLREAKRTAHRSAEARERAAWEAYISGAEQARSLRWEANAAAGRAQAALALLAPGAVAPASRWPAAWNAPTQVLAVHPAVRRQR